MTPDAVSQSASRDNLVETPSGQEAQRRCAVVVLAAGQGTRMQSALPKMLHPVAGRPMIDSVLAAATGAAPMQMVVVVGHSAERLRQHLAGAAVTFVTQEPQLGTGHAVQVASDVLDATIADVLVLYGDQPLFTSAMVAGLLAEHRRSGAQVTMAACVHPTGGQHGRITRDGAGRILRITEARDLIDEAPGPKEINTGIHCFRREWLAAHLSALTRQSNGEYYLTELIALAAAEGDPTGTHPWPVAAVEVELAAAWGVNDRVQLAEATRLARLHINEAHMLAGVTLLDPASTCIDYGVHIGRDTVIAPFSILTGATTIGEGCVIGPGARIRDSVIMDGAQVVDSTIEESEVGPGTDIGPYSHLRPGARIAGHVHLGNFVEVKNSTIGSGTMVGHVSYLGDATIGEHVNIGAGTITCNYDGVKKNPTTIGDGAFVGCDTMLIAPVVVGAQAITGAGSVVNRDVPAGRKVVGVPARPIPPRLTPASDEAGAVAGLVRRSDEE